MLTAEQRQDLSLTLEAFSSARTLSSWVYTSPQVFAEEVSQLFGQDWFCVGHRSAFVAGSVTPVDVGHHSLLINCTGDGTVKAFHNVCRHRGTRLIDHDQRFGQRAGKRPGCNKAQLIVCPYHGWAYTLEGELKAAPGMRGVAGFCRENQSLLAVQLSVWNGLLFVCLTGNEQTPDHLLEDFPVPVPNLAGLEIAASHEYEVNANWKLLCENYNECYHCPGGHPQLHQITRPAVNVGRQQRGQRFTGGPMKLREGFNTMSTSGVTQRKRLPGWPSADKSLVQYYHLYPNLFLSAVPDYVMIHLLLPVSHDRVTVQTHWLFDASEVAAEGFDPTDAVDFWDLTNLQDWQLCERAQKGQESGVHKAGFYHPQERCVHDFDRWYAGWLNARAS